MLAAIAMSLAFAFRFAIGTTTVICGILACVLVGLRDVRAPLRVVQHANWGILPLVAGLFVIVAALDRAGGVAIARNLPAFAHAQPPLLANLGIGAAIAVASAAFNNLPAALYTSAALHAAASPVGLTHASIVALDLSPNFTVNGSLATIMWMTIVRREGMRVTPWAFCKVGFVVTLPTLVAALLLTR
jgi:arsenical pump membrane protein